MPSTLGGLVVFTALLIPGFVFVERRETRSPGRAYSSLREVAVVLTASLLVNALVLGAFGVLRGLLPGATPDVGALIRAPRAEFDDHYLAIGIWSIVLLATACLLACLFAAPPERGLARLEDRLGGRTAELVRHWRGSPTPIREMSGWSAAFGRFDDCRTDLAVYLTDGSYVAGGLLQFNPQIAEDDDRSLQLAGPVQYRPAGAEHATQRDVGVVLIPAREIQMIEVTYVSVDS